MTDTYESTVITEADPAVSPEAQITEPAPEQKPEVKAEAPKLSRRDGIEASLKKIEDEDAAKAAPEKEDGAPKDAAKPEGKPEAAKAAPGKDGEVEKPPQQEVEGKRPSEGRGSEPPARFTDDAKAVWHATPRAVKAEVERVLSEHEAVAVQYREAKALHDEVRPYVEMAKQAGTTVKSALDRYVAFDRQIQADFGKGVASIAKEQGKQPIEAIGSLLRAYGITPQQYAQHVAQNPQAHQIAPQAPRDPMITMLAQQQQQIMQRLEAQDQQQAASTVQAEVDRWAGQHADFQTLEPAIAEILKSGIIERIHGDGLSLIQRLDAAYRMAGGKPALTPDPDKTGSHPAATAQARSNGSDAGTLSITGAPGGGKEPTIPRKPKSRRDTLEAAFAKITAQ